MLRHNYHHTLWERRAYTTPFEKRVREHSGLVIPVDVERHNLLHKNLFPPRKPNLRIMDNILDVLGPSERFNSSGGRVRRPRITELPEDRFSGLEDVTSMLLGESETHPSPEQARYMYELARHLTRQQVILEYGDT